MKRNEWSEWQRQVIIDDYVKPNVDENELEKKMAMINNKYKAIHQRAFSTFPKLRDNRVNV
ncbi:hypothetical protein [Bacillus suaedae]|uniref:Uncharacterized protein n=1 Tax=Halalkalibacter suaedae TaxID=2822140 RepID=A0A940WZB9_9BACI|nr:hypothetical protein [Bacillus suaedae]MBP3950904.1 hypothetical protein [Bacillus suaedae]